MACVIAVNRDLKDVELFDAPLLLTSESFITIDAIEPLGQEHRWSWTLETEEGPSTIVNVLRGLCNCPEAMVCLYHSG